MGEPEKTREALNSDGWFATGDIGRFNANGTLSIIDRKKSIFKLSQGEYVAPEHLENIFVHHPLIAMIWVYGDSLQSNLVAVVHPDQSALESWAKEANVSFTDFQDLCSKDEAKKRVLEALTESGKQSKIRGFEFIKAVHLDHEAFSVERGLLTPTMKTRRPDMKNHYQDELNKMYSSVGGK